MNNQLVMNLIMNNPNVRNNPMMQNAIRMYQNGDVNGLNSMANNLAREKNVDINKLAEDIKRKIGMN